MPEIKNAEVLPAGVTFLLSSYLDTQFPRWKDGKWALLLAHEVKPGQILVAVNVIFGGKEKGQWVLRITPGKCFHVRTVPDYTAVAEFGALGTEKFFVIFVKDGERRQFRFKYE